MKHVAIYLFQHKKKSLSIQFCIFHFFRMYVVQGLIQGIMREQTEREKFDRLIN